MMTTAGDITLECIVANHRTCQTPYSCSCECHDHLKRTEHSATGSEPPHDLASMPSGNQVDALDEILDYLTEDVAIDRANVIVPVAKAKLSALLVEAELNGLKAVQAKGQDWQEPNEGTAHELYARIKELEKQREANNG